MKILIVSDTHRRHHALETVLEKVKPIDMLIHLGDSEGYEDYIALNKESIIQEARSRGCDIVMFGHTHVPYLHQEDGITALNPGSISYPRQEGRRPSYIIMEIDKEGEAHYTINYL